MKVILQKIVFIVLELFVVSTIFSGIAKAQFQNNDVPGQIIIGGAVRIDSSVTPSTATVPMPDITEVVGAGVVNNYAGKPFSLRWWATQCDYVNAAKLDSTVNAEFYKAFAGLKGKYDACAKIDTGSGLIIDPSLSQGNKFFFVNPNTVTEHIDAVSGNLKDYLNTMKLTRWFVGEGQKITRVLVLVVDSKQTVGVNAKPNATPPEPARGIRNPKGRLVEYVLTVNGGVPSAASEEIDQGYGKTIKEVEINRQDYCDFLVKNKQSNVCIGEGITDGTPVEGQHITPGGFNDPTVSGGSDSICGKPSIKQIVKWIPCFIAEITYQMFYGIMGWTPPNHSAPIPAT